MSCAGVEPRSEADCEYTLDSGMLIKDIGYRCYSQIWNCYSYGKLIEGDEKSISLSWCFKSDRRGSNPRSRPWQGRALPTTPLSHKRVMGIEPTYPAWKAGVLPLNYTRTTSGWQDSNLRPPGPKPGALAKLSHTPMVLFCITFCYRSVTQDILYMTSY